jgi:hypothetical protein
MPLVATVDRTQDPLMAKLGELRDALGDTHFDLNWHPDKKQWAICIVESDMAAIIDFAVDAALEECDGLSK